MSNSDVFKKYAELALEKGLISNADAKSDLESGKGWDSKDISAIEALYGVKPNALKGMEYEKNIAERAHPNAVVVSPAYDKLNGLVENINERQNILLNIVNKPVNGHLTNHKYAEKQLMLSLVSLANYMDNTDNDELRVLADTCVEQLSKKANPLIIAGVVAVAAVGGLVYWSQHSPEVNKGFEQNARNLLQQLEDIITSGTGPLSMRTEYRRELKDQLKEVQVNISKLLGLHKVINHIVDEIEAPKAADSLGATIKAAKSLEDKSGYIKLYESFKAEAKNIEPMLTSLEKNFKSESYKHRQAKGDEGLFSKINDMLGGSLYGGKGLIADEFDDVLHAITPFRESVKEVLEIIKGAENAEHASVMKYEAAKSKMDEYNSLPTSTVKHDSTEEEKLLAQIDEMKNLGLS